MFAGRFEPGVERATATLKEAQTLGFALYYLCEWSGGPASIIFPFAEYYSRETSVGLSRVWLYEFELDWFRSILT